MHSPVNSAVAPSSKYPDRLTLHEGRQVTQVYGFYGQLMAYSERSNCLNFAAVSVPVVSKLYLSFLDDAKQTMTALLYYQDLQCRPTPTTFKNHPLALRALAGFSGGMSPKSISLASSG